MSTTGLEVFDSTIQKTNSWLNDVEKDGGLPNRHAAYQVLRATLHALRDRLIVDEVAEFAAQLPMLIRGLYYESWDPAGHVPASRRPKRVRIASALEHSCDRDLHKAGEDEARQDHRDWRRGRDAARAQASGMRPARRRRSIAFRSGAPGKRGLPKRGLIR